MARDSEPSVRPARRHHLRDAHLHVLAVVIFGLLAWSGLDGLDREVAGLAVPSLVVGLAGAVRAVLAVTGILPPLRRPAARQAVRGILVLIAVVALAAGFALAPSGMDRGFVIAVDAVLAGALAGYAFLGEPRRALAGTR
ncbi:rhomboid family intramembrane serine protease [Micromonospora sp. NPDC005299]|uniref:rhomboid family intramembrane serine protease n=1 Tax=Micromonospora sp. NPDC005299 TaxID=3364231 RepID=UPI003679B304